MAHTTAAAEWGSHTHPAVDDHLIQRVAEGDHDALHTLYESVAKNVYGFALSITKNTHDAEDVLQETILAVYHKAADYQGRGKPMAWIFTIARNFSLMKLREHQKTTSLEDNEILNSASYSHIDSAELRMTLQAVLRLLDSQEQQIVMLHAVEGMKNREIAEIMQLPLNTVLSKYHRSIKKLRKHLEGQIE
ncbi:MAG: sigma-70 family RNA polymerase sigma factor [Clostridiales bacterium]|nr:sigma-70 family RNA polymerase sigma factor [Clostridiales bacterium]